MSLDPPDAAMLTSLHVRRAVDGDESSTSWLVERLAPVLVAQAELRLGPVLRRVYDAHDLVHEAWLVLLPRMASLPPRDGRMTPVLLRFLSTTIPQKSRNLLRREARRSMQPERSETSVPLEHADPRSGVISVAVRRERHCQVRQAIEDLADGDRDVILMRGVEQLPPADVAAYLGISTDALSKRYRRALARLRELLPDSVFSELADPSA